ncbi:mate-domain-containing protein [Zychaea mexicana]|uniref:mate-domain-containing protein n=1 Tax=Zychaea mexicana TaxID=64656 RepID=UPI0022FEDA43|nr:mate-domain-containing protein [Zychaea mexicana]KAI9492443.1 mate-domain-containing protein [Zychaea mexicana]
MALARKLWTEDTHVDNNIDDERTALIKRASHDTGIFNVTATQDFRWLLKKGLSIAGTILLHQTMELTNLSMIGHMGAQELAAVTLANMLLAVMYYCVTGGISNSLETLCSQAYTGAKDKTMVGVYFQRVYLVLVMWSMVTGVVLWNGTSILEALGQEPELAAKAGYYLRCIFPSAVAYVTFDAHRKYLQAQGETMASVYILLIGAVLNGALQYFSFNVGMGLSGVPIGISIAIFFMLGAQLFYASFIRKTNINCWGGCSKVNQKEWLRFIKLVMSNLIVICSEYYVAELSILAISYLATRSSNSNHSDNDSSILIAAGSVLLRFHLSSHTVAIGLAAASATRVGHHIGHGYVQCARLSFHMGCWVSLTLSMPLSVFFWTFRDTLPYLFVTRDNTVVAQLISTGLPLLASFQLFGMIAGQLSGVLRGLGRQQVSAFISVIAFYGVTVPLGYTLIFRYDKNSTTAHDDNYYSSPWFGVNGVWVAFGIGYLIYALAQLLFLCMVVDWSAECAKVRQHYSCLADDAVDEQAQNGDYFSTRKDPVVAATNTSSYSLLYTK